MRHPVHKQGLELMVTALSQHLTQRPSVAVILSAPDQLPELFQLLAPTLEVLSLFPALSAHNLLLVLSALSLVLKQLAPNLLPVLLVQGLPRAHCQQVAALSKAPHLPPAQHRQVVLTKSAPTQLPVPHR